MTVVEFSCLKVLVVFLAKGLGVFLFLLANFLLYLLLILLFLCLGLFGFVLVVVPGVLFQCLLFSSEQFLDEA